MQAATVEVTALFDRDIRYLIPIFQRNYKWNRDDHWKPLWDDIRDVADHILEFGEMSDVPPHFLGAIVCEQIEVFGRDAHAVGVIDGQQRLTTLLLLLIALARVCEQRGDGSNAEYLRGFIENKPAVVKERPEHRYKVWPNVADRQHMLLAAAGEDGPSLPQQAVEFFAEAIDQWLDVGEVDDPLDDEDYTAEARLDAVITAATRHLKLVKIDLEANDNAQVIFETLNARGERLTDADLVRNFLFRQADEEGTDAEALHAQYWDRFEAPTWSDPIAHGRHQRDRMHLFLNDWLAMRLVGEVPASAVFRTFKEYCNKAKLPAEVIAKDIAVHGDVFLSFDAHDRDSFEWWFFRRVEEMDLITIYPVVLWLFAQSDEQLPPENRRRAMRALESFLVRRLIRRDSTRSYGSLFVEVLKALAAGPAHEADERVIKLLAEKTAETDVWPRDEDMRSAIRNTNVYKLRQGRLKMVLEGIERFLASTGKTETIELGHALWIEHLLPQGWRTEKAWGLPEGLPDPTRASLDRDHILHTLGNLTLTTSKLDIGLSNRPWAEKIEELKQHSALALNREIFTSYPDTWDESTIEARGEALAELIVKSWPGPEALTTGHVGH